MLLAALGNSMYFQRNFYIQRLILSKSQLSDSSITPRACPCQEPTPRDTQSCL